MRRHIHSAWTITKKTFTNFLEHDSFSHASSIAFSTIFSLPAILIIALSVASAFFEKELVQVELLHQMEALIGKGSTQEIEEIIRNATRGTDNVVAGIIGIITLIFSATTVFIALQSSLNNLWGIKPKPERSWLKYIVNRLLSFAMVVSFGFVLLVSLLIDALLVIFQNMVAHILDGVTAYVIAGVNLAISLFIITFIFVLLFKVLPDAKIRWRDLWTGAFITTLLFTAGKYLIGIYLGNSGIHSAYGAAGSVVLILIWVYYSTVIFLFGAELTFVHALEYGRSIEPYAHAVRFKVIEIPNSPKTITPTKNESLENKEEVYRHT